jgi:hypothetical protein
MNYPYVSRLNEEESLLFFEDDPRPLACAVCSRSRAEPALVRSGGRRIDVFFSRASTPAVSDRSLVPDPICWACVRDRAHGLEGSHGEWRAATASFLNALHASDPGSYYCGIRSLD